MSNALLTARNINKAFGDHQVIKGVDIDIEPGYITGIIGPNGAGKTTLVHLLTGHVLPDAGTVMMNGQDVTRLSPDARIRHRISRTFQLVDVFPGLTVFQNVQIACITRQGRNLRFLRSSGPESAADVERALNEVGLWEYRDRKGAELSHGQQRRLELAVTLATEPQLCFLDEPTSGVSPQERDQMLTLIKTLAAKRETTFLLIEHDMEVVFGLCKRVVVMHHGQILADGTPDDIRNHPEVRDIYLGEEL